MEDREGAATGMEGIEGAAGDGAGGWSGRGTRGAPTRRRGRPAKRARPCAAAPTSTPGGPAQGVSSGGGRRTPTQVSMDEARTFSQNGVSSVHQHGRNRGGSSVAAWEEDQKCRAGQEEDEDEAEDMQQVCEQDEPALPPLPCAAPAGTAATMAAAPDASEDIQQVSLRVCVCLYVCVYLSV